MDPEYRPVESCRTGGVRQLREVSIMESILQHYSQNDLAGPCAQNSKSSLHRHSGKEAHATANLRQRWECPCLGKVTRAHTNV